MLLVNPFTRQVINANPKGCNQYTGENCVGGKYYRDPKSKEYIGPYDTDDDVLIAKMMNRPEEPAPRRKDSLVHVQEIDDATIRALIEEGEIFRPPHKLKRNWNLTSEQARQMLED